MDKANFTCSVGFDFSPASVNALKNAIVVSGSSGIKAFYTLEMPKGIGLTLNSGTKDEIYNKFNLCVNSLKSTGVDFNILDGKFYDSLSNHLNGNSDLIFLGLNDTNNGYSKYVGSNAQKFIALNNQTVILQSANAQLIKRPVVLIQINVDNAINLNSIIKFLKIINPLKVKLVYFVSQHNQFQLNKQILQLEEIAQEINSKGFSVSFEVLKNIFDESTRAQLLNDYLKRQNCNLMIIGKRYLNKANGYNVSSLMIESIAKSAVPIAILGD